MGNQMFQLAYLYGQVKDGILPDIYIQDYTLWEKHADEIKKLYSEGVGYIPYVGVHLRVGGNPKNPSEPRYMENPFYTSMVNTGYYIKAMELFPRKEGYKFLIFSDDQDYAHAYFEGHDVGFDDSENDLQAFNKLASCHHLIGANSSFSWWAGFLNSQIDAKIIFPTEESWFADKKVRTKLLPKWIKIDP